jgi:hypothetical protein
MQTALMRGLCAEMDDRADVALDHLAQCWVVLLPTLFSILV